MGLFTKSDYVGMNSVCVVGKVVKYKVNFDTLYLTLEVEQKHNRGTYDTINLTTNNREIVNDFVAECEKGSLTGVYMGSKGRIGNYGDGTNVVIMDELTLVG